LSILGLFDTDGGGMSLLSLEEDTNGFQLCAWIPLTKKTPSTPPLQNQLMKREHGLTVETFNLLYWR